MKTIDVTRLEPLIELHESASNDFIFRLIATYLTSSAERVQELHTAFAQQDFDAMVQAAHTLGSTSAMVGATKLCENARALEAFAEEKKLGECKKFFTKVCELHPIVIHELSNEVQDYLKKES